MASIFSTSVTASLNKQDMSLMLLDVGTREALTEIKKVCQQANRRIQNIQNAGLTSPALKALSLERNIDSYSVFRVSGLNPLNETDWQVALYEYGRACSFLNNPTSSARGARQYINYQAKKYNIDFQQANKLVDIATNPQVTDNGDINILNYGSILEGLNDSYQTEVNGMFDNMQDFASDLENRMLDAWNNRKDLANSFLDRFLDDN